MAFDVSRQIDVDTLDNQIVLIFSMSTGNVENFSTLSSIMVFIYLLFRTATVALGCCDCGATDLLCDCHRRPHFAKESKGIKSLQMLQGLVTSLVVQLPC